MNEAQILDDFEDRNGATLNVLKFFAYGHLSPGPIQEASKQMCNLATDMVDRLPDSPELTVALRKLLESKDAYVRATVEFVQRK